VSQFNASQVFGAQGEANFGSVALDAFGNVLGSSFARLGGDRVSNRVQGNVNQNSQEAGLRVTGDAATQGAANLTAREEVRQAQANADLDALFAANLDAATDLAIRSTERLASLNVEATALGRRTFDNLQGINNQRNTPLIQRQADDDGLIAADRPIDNTSITLPEVTRPRLFSDLADTLNTTGTGLTSAFLLSSLPPLNRVGIELSSERLLFNTVDSITEFTDDAGRLVQTVQVGQIGAQPLGGVFSNPTFSVLEDGARAANGNLSISFNGRGGSLSIANGLDFIGRQVFFAQSLVQGVDLGASFVGDFRRSGLSVSSISSETLQQAVGTFIDIGFNALGTLGGIPGAAISLGRTFFGDDINEAARVSFERQQREIALQVENNILPPPTGPRF
jgi:hypothetical protein